jgi:hypothetical protein
MDGHTSREIDLTNFVSGICSESFKPLKWSRYLSAVLTIIDDSDFILSKGGLFVNSENQLR